MSMKVNVGSKNPTKVQGVKNLLKDHPLFKDAEIVALEVQVEEFGHPKTLKDTIAGAKDRAKAAFINCQYSFGLESGLIEVPDAKTGFMETTVCAIFDGKKFHLGLAPSFEWPKQMIDLILAGQDGSQAFKQIGLTTREKIGVAEGGVHVLTHGKLSRTNLNELATMMALIHLENPEHY